MHVTVPLILTFVLVWSEHYFDHDGLQPNGPMNHNKSDATLTYLAQFRVHQKFVQAHLKGSLNDEQPLPSFSSPSSYWSPEEKDLFFHGLAVYSRFRPDLIAESIKTKTTFDVCVYLDHLHNAIPSEINGSLTSSLEPAMEVSSAWIQNEEKFAAELTQFESCPWVPDAVSASTSVDEMDKENELQNGPWSKKRLRKLPRMRNRLLEIGVDSKLASNNNLDLFHLSSLARLTRLYGSLTGPSYEVSISADTIQLIVAIIKEFVSEVVRGSLISKEQEIRLKSTLKVWKYNQNEITVENVQETLKSMKIAHSNLKEYFTELVAEVNSGISLSDSSIDTEMRTKDDDNNGDITGDQNEDENETSNEDNPSNPSDASEQHSALTEFWLPQSLRRCLLPRYIRVSENEDDDILPQIDEIEIQRELKEEEELDARDLLASREYEAELWAP